MVSWFCHASEISIIMAWGRDRPVWSSSSTALSSTAESLAPGVAMGKIREMSSPNRSVRNWCCRAFIS